MAFNTAEDESGLLESAAYLNSLISDEISSGIKSSRIILGGFSQGGTMSLLTGITSATKLGAIVILSGRLVMRSKIESVSFLLSLV